jgi:hypothetical protein
MRWASDLVFMIAIVHHDSHRRFSAAHGTIRGFAPRIARAVNNSQHERTQRLWCDVSSRRGGAASSTRKTRQERNRNSSRFFSTRIPSRSNLVRTRSGPGRGLDPDEVRTEQPASTSRIQEDLRGTGSASQSHYRSAESAICNLQPRVKFRSPTRLRRNHPGSPIANGQTNRPLKPA